MAIKNEHKSRRVNNRGWIRVRKTVQYTMLAVFILFFIMSRRDGGWAGSLVNLPMRLDPLLVLANLLSSRTFLAGSSLALITLVLALLFGRAWCGWVCPLGTTLDIFSLKKIRGNRLPPGEKWRSVKYVLMISILTASAFGSLTLLVLDPITLFYRVLTISIWPALDRSVMFFERLLYEIPFLSGPIEIIDSFLRPRILPTAPAFFQGALLFGLFFLAIIFLNYFAERFWCRYLCPLGGFLALVSKIALFQRKVGGDCKGCVLCTRACPTGTIDPQKLYASDPSECTMCLECLEPCPRSMITFNPGLPKAVWSNYDPSRRQTLLTIGVTSVAVVLSSSGVLAKREPSFLIRPPGAREINNDVLAMTKCIRCSACMRACPTSVIQSGMLEAGVEGFGAPILNMRMGYCDFSCNACGQVCPVQAIPPLSLEDKRTQTIGKAYIDINRCIAWADHTPCIVCEEMCPLPQKAILLEEVEAWSPDETHRLVKLPHVLRDICIGCGICEYKCPVNGEAAIRVYVPSAPVPF